MQKSIFTQAVHAGEHAARPDFQPVTTPIYRSSAFTYPSMDDLDAVFEGSREGYVYARYGNPTVTAFEQAIATLESTDEAVAYASGMAAVHGALLGAGAKQGTCVVSAADVYGATYALQEKLLGGMGVATKFVDITDLEQVAETIRTCQPVAVICEIISNPLLRVADVAALAEMAHAVGAALIVDSTFATPWLLRPAELGVDYVLHSATKYIAGHGDVLAGVVACSAERAHGLRENQKLLGANLGPDAAWLALRGLKTLPLRMRQHCDNALSVAQWLSQQPGIASVNYPGLESHPQHDLAKSMLGGRGYGGMLSFEIDQAHQAEVFRFMEALQLVQPATTLGDVYSLVLYPAHSSHRALPPEMRAELGIGDGLVRMNTGIEDPRDIVADLSQALESIG